MFGYILANPEQLDEAQQLRYRSCYCGLCHAIGREASQLCRLSLNYDMTFLVLLLSSLYEPDEAPGRGRCIVHPAKPRDYWITDATRYCADMNVTLAYYNSLDDWTDERSLPKLAQAQIFRRAARRAATQYPRQTEAVTRCLGVLSQLEQAKDYNPDAAANSFGELMGELFVWRESDYWSPTLRAMGQALGRFIYILDAVCDLDADLRKGHYNPLSARAATDSSPAAFRDDLILLIGDVTAAFERLPLVQDAPLLRNILYSGVWAKFLLAEKRHLKQENKGVQS